MHALVTTCTADKLEMRGLCAARLRYRGARIEAAEARAQRDGTPLLFLSGVYGLITADHPLPWYDHALLDEEVDGLVERVVEQLRDLRVDRLTGLLQPAESPGWGPYHRLLSLGCAGAGVSLRVVLTSL